MHQDFDMNVLIRLAEEAGEAIMKVYATDFDVDYKDDRSPLTLADEHADRIITEGLQSAWPDIPIISEESLAIPYEDRRDWETFWLVDPLDGTKEFVKKNGEFTINIGLIHQRQPVLGLVYAPALNCMYFGKVGDGSFKRNGTQQTIPLSTGPKSKDDKSAVIIGSRSHNSPAFDTFVEEKSSDCDAIEILSVGSSLKFCWVAEGKADLYPRFGQTTMEWDTAAGHAIIRAVGKRVVRMGTDEELIYNKETLRNDAFLCH